MAPNGPKWPTFIATWRPRYPQLPSHLRSTVAEESLMAIRTVVAFGGEASALRRFERELTRAKMGGIRASAATGGQQRPPGSDMEDLEIFGGSKWNINGI